MPARQARSRAIASSTRRAAAEKPQRRRVERLDAERQPVDAGGAKAAKRSGLGRGRVGFQRDFERRVRSATAPRDPLDQRRRPSSGAISDGVPPPKKIDVRLAVRASARRDGRDR